MVYKAPPLPPPIDDDTPHEIASLTADGETYDLGARTMVIGRSKDCDIRLSDPNVSRRHAEVRPDGAGYKIFDLDSTNGIEIDGKRVKELALTDGMRFTIGTTELSYSQRLS